MDIDRVVQGDCIAGLAGLPAGMVDLAFADPPFNIGYDYDVYRDRKQTDEYLDWTERWGREVFRVLKDQGSFWLAIGDEFAAELKVLFQRIGFHSRSWVIWYYTFGVNCTRKFSRSHAHLFHFVKDPDNFVFNADEVKVPSARQLVYADARAANGRLPDDTWVLRPQDLEGGFASGDDTWYFPRVCGTFKERAGWHGCQMPERLLERIIRVSSNPGDLVLDPFAGSGSTLVTAKKLGRRHLGFELSESYAAQVQARLDRTLPGEPLEGPLDAAASAPKSAAGRRLAVFENPYVVLKPRTEQADIDRGILEAFVVAGDGFSVDRVIADPDLNREFVRLSQRLGVSLSPFDLNQRLMNLRKARGLSRLGARRKTRVGPEALDPFEFACEIAVQSLHAGAADWTIDRCLCDPDQAGRFDALVRKIAGQELPSLLIRWTALRLRKRAHDIRDYQLPSYVPLPRAGVRAPELDLKTTPSAPAVYWLQEARGRRLYVGHTLDLRARLQRQLEKSTFDHWGVARDDLEIRYQPLPATEAHTRTRVANQAHWIRRWRPIGNYEKLAAP